MSTTETQEPMEMGTKPLAEHEWLNKLVGNWKVTSEMSMPDGSTCTGEGMENVVNFGGLWALGEGKATMPDGAPMEYRSGLGYDVSFKAYKGFWVANVSSHLWKYDCELSADGKKMTMRCVGPDMMGDKETANYRDEIDIIDDNNRTLTSYGEMPDGSWAQFMKATYVRV